MERRYTALAQDQEKLAAENARLTSENKRLTQVLDDGGSCNMFWHKFMCAMIEVCLAQELQNSRAEANNLRTALVEKDAELSRRAAEV